MDQLLGDRGVQELVERHGRSLVLHQLRGLLAEAREQAAAGDESALAATLGEPAARLTVLSFAAFSRTLFARNEFVYVD